MPDFSTQIRALVCARLEEDKKRAPSDDTRVFVGGPCYDDREIVALLETLVAGRISQGPVVAEFEKAFARYVGVKHAIAVNSGSSANLLALSALLEAGELTKGDEVIVPAATFCTAVSPVIQVGLVPVYVDVHRDTHNIDPVQVEKAIGPKTKGLLVVHSLGNPADLNALLEIARRRKLVVMEDCCEAHGTALAGKKVGGFGAIGTYSFFVAHNMTTGEGGMCVTDRDDLAENCRSMREFGRLLKPVGRFEYSDGHLTNYDKRYVFDRLGFNVRMTDLAASLGIVQLEKLDHMNAARRSVVEDYDRTFARHAELFSRQEVQPNGTHTYYGYQVVLREDSGFNRTELAEYLEAAGIETRPFFGGCLPDQPGFRGQPGRVVGELPVSRLLRDRAMFIGCHPGVNERQRQHVQQTLEAFLRKRRSAVAARPQPAP